MAISEHLLCERKTRDGFGREGQGRARRCKGQDLCPQGSEGLAKEKRPTPTEPGGIARQSKAEEVALIQPPPLLGRLTCPNLKLTYLADEGPRLSKTKGVSQGHEPGQDARSGQSGVSRGGGGRGRLWGQEEGGAGAGSREKQADTGWGTEGLPGDGAPGQGLSWVEQVALKVTWG